MTSKPGFAGIHPDEVQMKLLKATEPPQRKAGIKIAGAAELVEKLKNEAQVI